jgi:hypothetical protein
MTAMDLTPSMQKKQQLTYVSEPDANRDGSSCGEKQSTEISSNQNFFRINSGQNNESVGMIPPIIQTS